MTAVSRPPGDTAPPGAPPAAQRPADDRVLGRWLWERLRSAWPLLAVAVAIVVAAALTATQPDDGLPLSPTSDGPDGTAALVDVLAELGRPARVVAPGGIDDAPVVLLLRDQLDGAQARDLLARVRAGARLVVADPDAALARSGNGERLLPDVVGPAGLLDRTIARACRIPALRDVDEIQPGGGVLYEVHDPARGCFTTADGAWLVVTPEGRGHVIALGGPGVLTNAGLRSADNAVLATQLLTPAGSGGPTIVRPVPPSAAGDDGTTLADLVPAGVRRMLLQLLVAFGVYVMWRARRLGRPLVDEAPVRLASSDLVTAVGALFARNATRAAAVQRIADDTRTRLARRLDLPRNAAAVDVADAVAARTGRDPTAVAAALTPRDPTDDADLLTATAALDALEQAVATALSPAPEPLDVH